MIKPSAIRFSKSLFSRFNSSSLRLNSVWSRRLAKNSVNSPSSFLKTMALHVTGVTFPELVTSSNSKSRMLDSLNTISNAFEAFSLSVNNSKKSEPISSSRERFVTAIAVSFTSEIKPDRFTVINASMLISISPRLYRFILTRFFCACLIFVMSIPTSRIIVVPSSM